jgi:CRP-like cAMP-binding protein
VSLVSVLPNGDTAEIAIIGNDGFIGTPLLMGGESTPNRAVVQSGGHAYRIKKADLKRELARKGALQEIALQYVQVLITQMAQTIVCNRHHSVVQQLCRWLLLSLDRLPSNVVAMTQGLIANMLGVRPEGVTSAAGRLQAEGVISYARGRIIVLDRPAMEQRACECYGVVKREQERLLPNRAAAEKEEVGRSLESAGKRREDLPSPVRRPGL